MEVGHTVRLLAAEKIVASSWVVLLECYCSLSASIVAINAVKTDRYDTTQLSSAYQFQNSTNTNHVISVLFNPVYGQVDIFNMENGMDLISFRFHLILNQRK